MDNRTKERIIEKYKRVKLHVLVAEAVKDRDCRHRLPQRKKDYLIRRGQRARLVLAQMESIPFLTNGVNQVRSALEID